MAKLVMHGRFGAVEGKRDALVANLLRAAQEVESAKGCRLYLVSTSPDDPHGVWVTEVWDSAEDHAASLQLESVRALIKETMPLIAELPSGAVPTRFELRGGFGA